GLLIHERLLCVKKKSFPFSRVNTIIYCFMTRICSEKCIVGRFHCCVNNRLYLHKPRGYGLPHTWAPWEGLLLQSYRPVQ
uniref:Uncharacterized protein n=1 Tax=Spermophilus dauricus TaxID=99837 RepID=A0A8C9P1K1_SPEDA